MDVFLARQPIFDARENVTAYEILYRTGFTNVYTGTDGEEASTKVLYNVFHGFGIDNLTKGRPVFINFTENLICDEMATLFPQDLLVVEILEDIIPHYILIEKTKNLKDMGYKIALDDFVYRKEYEDLLDIVDIVKIDFLSTPKENIELLSKYLIYREITILAEKIESREEFQYAKSLGFSLFQGYFFSKPEIVAGKSLTSLRSNYLQLLAEVNKEEISFDKIANIISRDLSLTYNLLKLVNSAAMGFRHKIQSVKHGIVALGQRQMKKWVYLVLINTVAENETEELTKLSLIRARFIELIALRTNYRNDSEELFLMGLLSLLDAILQRPKEEILEEIQSSSRVRQALINEEGKFGILYKLIISYEKGQWDEFMEYTKELKIDANIISEAYMEAILWYNKLQTVNE